MYEGDPRPAARISAMLKRYNRPRAYTGDYDGDFARRILDDLRDGGYRIVADGPGRFPEDPDPVLDFTTPLPPVTEDPGCYQDMVDDPEVAPLPNDNGVEVVWACCGKKMHYWNKNGIYRIFPEEARMLHFYAHLDPSLSSTERRERYRQWVRTS